MAAGTERGLQVQLVTTDDAAGRVHDHVVADASALRVQRLQHAQGAAVPVVAERAALLAAVVQLQFAAPAGLSQVSEASQANQASQVSSRFTRQATHFDAQKSRCSRAISSSASATGPATHSGLLPAAKTWRQGKLSVGFSGCAPVRRSSFSSLRP